VNLEIDRYLTFSNGTLCRNINTVRRFKERSMKRQTGRFLAIGDDGRRYTVYVYTDFTDAGTSENPNAVLEGPKELRGPQAGWP